MCVVGSFAEFATRFGRLHMLKWEQAFPHRNERRLDEYGVLLTEEQFIARSGSNGWLMAAGRVPDNRNFIDAPLVFAGERKIVCYMLRSETGKCYMGWTNFLERRVRQHNGIIAGGATRTTQHRPWSVGLVVSGFSRNQQAKRFESAWLEPEKEGVYLTTIQAGTVSNRLGNRSVNTNTMVLRWLLRGYRLLHGPLDGALVVEERPDINERLCLPKSTSCLAAFAWQ